MILVCVVFLALFMLSDVMVAELVQVFNVKLSL